MSKLFLKISEKELKLLANLEEDNKKLLYSILRRQLLQPKTTKKPVEQSPLAQNNFNARKNIKFNMRHIKKLISNLYKKECEASKIKLNNQLLFFTLASIVSLTMFITGVCFLLYGVAHLSKHQSYTFLATGLIISALSIISWLCSACVFSDKMSVYAKKLKCLFKAIKSFETSQVCGEKKVLPEFIIIELDKDLQALQNKIEEQQGAFYHPSSWKDSY